MKGDVFGVAPSVVQEVEHSLSARVVERVDDDECVAVAVRVGGEPCGDGVSGALVVMLIREVMFFYQVVVKKNSQILALC